MSDQTGYQFPIATAEQRFLNYILDQLCIITIIVLGAFLVGFTDFIDFQEYSYTYYGFFVLYYILFEGFTGVTPAKLLTETRTVNTDGSPLSFGRAVGRSVCRLIPLEQLTFLGGNGRPRGLHDWIPKTSVISVKEH